MPHAEHESAFYQVRNDDDALGVGQQRGWDAAGRDRHDFVEDVPRVVDDDGFAILRPVPGGGQEQQTGDRPAQPMEVFIMGRIVAIDPRQGNGNLYFARLEMGRWSSGFSRLLPWIAA